MQHLDWRDIPNEHLNPLASRQVIHCERITMARLALTKGAVVPEHHHENEQVSTVKSGALKFLIGGKDEVIVRAGGVLVIPPNLPHSAEALEDTHVLDLFSPRREDWIRGDDAYLRGK
jgi:quercetin dioxygenase-like cupin family protein